MSTNLVVASIDRAGDHAAVVGVLFVVIVVGGLLYGLVRLAARTRSVRNRRREP
jgi:hypothetical protein